MCEREYKNKLRNKINLWNKHDLFVGIFRAYFTVPTFFHPFLSLPFTFFFMNTTANSRYTGEKRRRERKTSEKKPNGNIFDVIRNSMRHICSSRPFIVLRTYCNNCRTSPNLDQHLIIIPLHVRKIEILSLFFVTIRLTKQLTN